MPKRHFPFFHLLTHFFLFFSKKNFFYSNKSKLINKGQFAIYTKKLKNPKKLIINFCLTCFFGFFWFHTNHKNISLFFTDFISSLSICFFCCPKANANNSYLCVCLGFISEAINGFELKGNIPMKQRSAQKKIFELIW